MGMSPPVRLDADSAHILQPCGGVPHLVLAYAVRIGLNVVKMNANDRSKMVTSSTQCIQRTATHQVGSAIIQTQVGGSGYTQRRHVNSGPFASLAYVQRR